MYVFTHTFLFSLIIQILRLKAEKSWQVLGSFAATW